MNFRKPFTFAMTMTLASGTLINASAQQQGRTMTDTQGTVVQQLPPDKLKILPDIEVKVAAPENASLTPLISNGSGASLEGGRVFVRSMQMRQRLSPPVRVTLPGRSNDVDARMLADIGNLVQEKNEQNNKAGLKFTGQVLH